MTLQRGTTYKSALLDQPGPVLLGLASIGRNGGFRDDKLRTYGGDSAEKLILGPGALFVALKDVTQSGDLLGAVARVPARVAVGRLTQDTVKLTITDPTMPATYVYWLLRTPEYRAYCRARAMGTTNLSLSRDDFLAFPVPPVTAARLSLVDALEALDDKIDSNQRLAALLGNLSGEWFDELQRTATETIGLGDVVEVIDCLHSKKPEQQPVGKLLLQLNNIRKDGLVDLDEQFLIAESDYANWTRRMELRAGDCVITNVGRVGAVARMPNINAALGRNMTGLRCRPEWPFPTVLIEALLSSRTRRAIDQLTDSGTVMSALNVRNIPRLPMPALDPQTFATAETILAPIWSLREALLSESRTLVASRNELLRKLVSGKICLTDSSKPAEATEPLVEEHAA